MRRPRPAVCEWRRRASEHFAAWAAVRGVVEALPFVEAQGGLPRSNGLGLGVGLEHARGRNRRMVLARPSATLENRPAMPVPALRMSWLMAKGGSRGRERSSGRGWVWQGGGACPNARYFQASGDRLRQPGAWFSEGEGRCSECGRRVPGTAERGGGPPQVPFLPARGSGRRRQGRPGNDLRAGRL